MPKKAAELSALDVSRIKTPGLKAVGGVAGLHLQVQPSGATSWILRVSVGDKRRDIGLGGYPDVTLAEARERARAARDEIRQGVDPIEARKARKAALAAKQASIMTFKQAAKACHESKAAEFKSAKHRADWINSIEMYANPVIGSMQVSDIEVPHVLSVLQPIWMTKTETATRVRQRIESVLAWAAVGKYRSGDNPAVWRGCLEHALPKPSKIREISHFPALDWQEVAEFMAKLRARQGISARALEFAILTATRSGEVRGATWVEIDLEERLWTIPASRMKGRKKKHTVPLSDAAMKIIQELPVHEGCPFVFVSPRGKQLSDMALSQVTRRMGVSAVPHGFRSTFKDWARNLPPAKGYPDEASELALAHVGTDTTRAAYARDQLIGMRANLMQDWAEFCGYKSIESNVTPIRKQV